VLFFQSSPNLGNQLFQYAALKKLTKENETLVLFGFDRLQQLVEELDAIVLNHRLPGFLQIWLALFHKFLRLLARCRLINSIYEEKSLQPKVIHQAGLLSRLTLVQVSFFQNEALISHPAMEKLQLKAELMPKILLFFKQNIQDKTPIFVHVRRRDYLDWPRRSIPAVLPASYYQECIEQMRTRFDQPFFIFTSDDPFYVYDVFGQLVDAMVSTGSATVDFALMCQCEGGILSASSFAWWAAFWVRR